MTPKTTSLKRLTLIPCDIGIVFRPLKLDFRALAAPFSRLWITLGTLLVPKVPEEVRNIPFYLLRGSFSPL